MLQLLIHLQTIYNSRATIEPKLAGYHCVLPVEGRRAYRNPKEVSTM
jgi:hypothetical protein